MNLHMEVGTGVFVSAETLNDPGFIVEHVKNSAKQQFDENQRVQGMAMVFGRKLMSSDVPEGAAVVAMVPFNGGVSTIRALSDEIGGELVIRAAMHQLETQDCCLVIIERRGQLDCQSWIAFVEEDGKTLGEWQEATGWPHQRAFPRAEVIN